ncbi:hypothetical protein [Xylophilus sp. GOD-11R]|uniref:hypothetical protein n=1 Tax=Xylophilus sp. GOD-11R TaxID=3089814 RepID=UPI00298C872A|nr:hypothetical protein [Xylophilus sp. GOD-11R]WPB54971.1 hypothetical protein R9X41_12385 [Xylophilus sp. GOD-11R]
MPDRLPDCIDPADAERASTESIWTSAEVPVTSVYQVAGPDFSEWSRRWYIRLLLAVVVICPLILIGWLAWRFFG